MSGGAKTKSVIVIHAQSYFEQIQQIIHDDFRDNDQASECSQITDVPEGSYGILLRFGEVKSVATGPTKLRSQTLLEKTVVIEIVHESKLENFSKPIRFVVNDPVKYYIATGDSLSLDKIFETHLEILKDKGEIQSMENLMKSINKLNLPIAFEDDN